MTTATPSPSKKVFTINTKTAIDASNTHRDAIVPDDLSQRLQSIGMRVRKSVTEGYNTDRVSTFAVPPAPNSSPLKSPTQTTHSTPTTVFRTANVALNSVFPAGSSRIPLTPSPKKRTRADVEPRTEMRRNLDGTMGMDTDEIDSDDDPVMVILGPNADATAFTPPRKIKPLRVRRDMASPRINLDDPFTDSSFPNQASSVNAPSILPASMGDMQDSMDMDMEPTEGDRKNVY